MVRVKGGFTGRRRKKKLFKRTKGFRITRRTQLRAAREAVYKALQHATRHRRTKKREMRRLWTARINAAVRALGMKYHQLISAMKKANIQLDRKILADIALHHPSDFVRIVEAVKKT